MDDVYISAMHEAGHAVMRLFHRRPTQAAIDYKGNGWCSPPGGWALIEAADADGRRKVQIQLAKEALAGPLAEMRVRKLRRRGLLVGSDDIRRARKCLAYWNSEVPVLREELINFGQHHLQIEVATFLRRRPVWRAVQIIAAALLADGYVDSEAMEAVAKHCRLPRELIEQ